MEGEIGNSVVLSMDDKWVDSVLRRMEGSRRHGERATELPTILRVPPNLRSGDPYSYTPRIVSIGPYHRGEPELSFMEEIKWQLLDELVLRTTYVSSSGLLRAMKNLEAETRMFYSEEIKLDSNKFVEMMLLDGCLLVQAILPNSTKSWKQLNKSMWFDFTSIQDLLMLENQLPFLVVRRLLEEYQIPESDCYEGCIQMLGIVSVVPKGIVSVDQLRTAFTAHHFLRLFHLLYVNIPKHQTISSSDCCNPLNLVKKIKNGLNLRIRLPEPQDHERNPPPQNKLRNIPCVTQLAEAGIKFKVKKSNTIFDVWFRRGVLWIPTIEVKDFTNSIFRNLIALEQCCPQFKLHFTSYTIFMDAFIDSSSDVALLIEAGILGNHMGDDDSVASLFNRLNRNITYRPGSNPDDGYLIKIIDEITNYSEVRRHSWRAKFMHDYFSSPWSAISLVAGTILLGLTITQTIYSILSYNKT